MASAAVQGSPDAEALIPADDDSAQREALADEQASPHGEAAADLQMPLITAAPLTPSTASTAASETTSPAATTERPGTLALGGSVPLAASQSRAALPSSSVVQRDLASDAGAVPVESSVGGSAHFDAGSPADGAPAHQAEG